MTINGILPLTDRFTLINPDNVLDKQTGYIIPVTNASVKESILAFFNKSNIFAADMVDRVEVVSSMDINNIDLYFKTSDGIPDFKNRIFN